MNDINSFFTSFTSNRVIMIVLVLLSAWFLSKAIQTFFNKLAERYPARRIMIKNFIPLVNIGLNLAGLALIFFWVLKIPANAFLTLGVSAGVAIGFAVKDLLANIFGGLVIIFTRPFNIGDKIEVDSFYGEVTDISLLKVKLVTPDDSIVIIPSKLFLEKSVSNANGGELNCQVVTEFIVPGTLSIEFIKEVVYEAVLSSPYSYLKKPVTVLCKDEFHSFVSVMKIKAKSYVFDHRYEAAYSSDIYQRVKEYLISQNVIDDSFFRINRNGMHD